jgi:hypothetical protein
VSGETSYFIPEPVSNEVFAWKFFIGADYVKDPDNPAIEYRACVAIVLARDEDAARRQLLAYAEFNGARFTSWLKVAKITKVPLREGAVLTWFA